MGALGAMSYDLVFWRQLPDLSLSPVEITRQLCEQEQQVDGLVELPVGEIVREVEAAFPNITTDGGLTYWEGGDDGMFEIYTSSQHVHFCCRQLLTDHCNTLIEILNRFECPLYDPQVDERFGPAGGS